MAPHTIRGDLHYYNGESGFCQDEKLRFAAFVPASLQYYFIITSALLQHYFSRAIFRRGIAKNKIIFK
jgi:hypothetical protein